MLANILILNACMLKAMIDYYISNHETFTLV